MIVISSDRWYTSGCTGLNNRACQCGSWSLVSLSRYILCRKPRKIFLLLFPCSDRRSLRFSRLSTHTATRLCTLSPSLESRAECDISRFRRSGMWCTPSIGSEPWLEVGQARPSLPYRTTGSWYTDSSVEAEYVAIVEICCNFSSCAVPVDCVQAPSSYTYERRKDFSKRQPAKSPANIPKDPVQAASGPEVYWIIGITPCTTRKRGLMLLEALRLHSVMLTEKIVVAMAIADVEWMKRIRYWGV